MGVVINETKKRHPVPVSEQTQMIEYVLSLVEKSPIFGGLPVSLNFIDASQDCVCVRLGADNYKTAEYIDGSYEAQVSFSVILRRINIRGVDERLEAIDLINQFGQSLESIEEFDASIEDVEINSISQRDAAGLIFRDESGLEDNGANFVILYDKN